MRLSRAAQAHGQPQSHATHGFKSLRPTLRCCGSVQLVHQDQRWFAPSNSAKDSSASHIRSTRRALARISQRFHHCKKYLMSFIATIPPDALNRHSPSCRQCRDILTDLQTVAEVLAVGHAAMRTRAARYLRRHRAGQTIDPDEIRHQAETVLTHCILPDYESRRSPITSPQALIDRFKPDLGFGKALIHSLEGQADVNHRAGARVSSLYLEQVESVFACMAQTYGSRITFDDL